MDLIIVTVKDKTQVDGKIKNIFETINGKKKNKYKKYLLSIM